MYTPTTNAYHDQATQDWGTHEFTYGIYGHEGDWRTGLSEWQGRAVNQPFIAFQSSSHPGFLGKSISLASVDTSQVDIRALKLQESGNEWIIRVQELFGESVSGVTVTVPGQILSGAEVDGQERTITEISPEKGALSFNLSPYELKSFRVSVKPSEERMSSPTSIPMVFIFNEDVASMDTGRNDGRFGHEQLTLPGELLPEEIIVDGIPFEFGGRFDGQNNVLACNGQKILIPKTGQYNKLYVLAAAERDTFGIFKAGRNKMDFSVQAFNGNIGQFDNRTWDDYGQVTGLETGYIKRDEVAWFSDHLHNDTANLPYQFAYIFKYGMDVDPSMGSIQLPEDPTVKIFAMTLSANPYDDISLVQPLYDDFTERKPIVLAESHYVTDDLKPTASADVIHRSTIQDLPIQVTPLDYADLHLPNGVTIQYMSNTIDESGEELWKSIPVSMAGNGMYDLMPGDKARNTWVEEGEGRLVMDLQKDIDIDSLHIFTASDLSRGRQWFSVWGWSGKGTPAFTGDPKEEGWTFITFPRALNVWGKGAAGYRILSEQPNKFRYLMFISEASGHGPVYFREVDVFEKEQ